MINDKDLYKIHLTVGIINGLCDSKLKLLAVLTVLCKTNLSFTPFKCVRFKGVCVNVWSTPALLSVRACVCAGASLSCA